jgi:4,5-dihydroxyphthalate decarboxylase
MHLIGVRRALAQDASLCIAICDAFEQAKREAVAALSSYQALAVTHPWAPVEATRLRDLFSGDFWPYGIEPNSEAIEAIPRWSLAQGLASRKLTTEELFATASLNWSPTR